MARAISRFRARALATLASAPRPVNCQTRFAGLDYAPALIGPATQRTYTIPAAATSETTGDVSRSIRKYRIDASILCLPKKLVHNWTFLVGVVTRYFSTYCQRL